MRRARKLMAMMLVFVTCFVFFSVPVSAALASKSFHIRLSSDYSDTGATITMTPTNSSGTLGIIQFNKTVVFRNSVDPECHIQQGTTYSYSISKMKDGATIKLTYIYGGDVDYLTNGGMAFMNGKIHIDGKAKFANIWKIDGFHINHTVGTLHGGSNGTKWGIYFRNT